MPSTIKLMLNVSREANSAAGSLSLCKGKGTPCLKRFTHKSQD